MFFARCFESDVRVSLGEADVERQQQLRKRGADIKQRKRTTDAAIAA